MTFILARLSATGWNGWAIVVTPVLIFIAIAALLGIPRGEEDDSPLAAAARKLERIVGIPGWTAGTLGVGLGGLVLAMVGFYWDVAWHIDKGRDKQLFTPPHVLILLGLASILLAGAVAVALASATRTDTRLRLGSLRIPWSALALGVVGGGAVFGFPLDDRWHKAYGIDVTMWGPTHLIMIGGASVATVVLWLVLAEGGVKAVRKTRGWRLHALVAGGALAGLSALQGEFDFGVPQFQLLYHPVLILAAAGIALTAARMVLGRGGAIRTAVGFCVIRGFVALFVGGLGYTTPHFPLYLAPAIGVELAAWIVGTDRLARYAVASAIGLVTVGLAGEWGWSHVWFLHPWTTSMLRDAVLVGGLAALGGAGIGVAFGVVVSGRGFDALQAFGRRRAAVAGLLAAACLLGVALGLPVKRVPSDVTGTLTLRKAGPVAYVDLTLMPANAADHARWFEVMTWQSGSLIVSKLDEVSPGHYRAEHPVPIAGKAKTLVRLQRGAELSAIPVRFPEDPQILAPEIAPVNRTARFERDSKLLMREAHRGNPLTARIIFALLGAIVVSWLTVLFLAGRGILTGRPAPARREVALEPAA